MENDQRKLEPEQMIYKLNPSNEERKLMDAFNLIILGQLEGVEQAAQAAQAAAAAMGVVCCVFCCWTYPTCVCWALAGMDDE